MVDDNRAACFLSTMTTAQAWHIVQRRAKARRRKAQLAATAAGTPLPFPLIPR